jgi:hypothetical protein
MTVPIFRNTAFRAWLLTPAALVALALGVAGGLARLSRIETDGRWLAVVQPPSRSPVLALAPAADEEAPAHGLDALMLPLIRLAQGTGGAARFAAGLESEADGNTAGRPCARPGRHRAPGVRYGNSLRQLVIDPPRGRLY